MVKKKKEDEALNSLIQNIDITTISGDTIFNSITVKGKTVSLNFKAETFFGVGSIWLDINKYSCVIPDTINPKEEEIIKNALKRGILIEGDKYYPRFTRNNDVLEEYWNVIRQFGLESMGSSNAYKISFNKFKNLLKYGTDRNWTAKEIANHCISEEIKYKNRKQVVKLLTELIKLTDAPDTLVPKPNS